HRGSAGSRPGPPAIDAYSLRIIFSPQIARRKHLWQAITKRVALLDKPLNALHNPVTLHVVCQHMLLRSVDGGRERHLNAHVSQGGWPVLVLNADFRPLSYYPLSLWSWQDAIKAVFLDRVNIVE